jgi:hypothetical protein
MTELNETTYGGGVAATEIEHPDTRDSVSSAKKSFRVPSRVASAISSISVCDDLGMRKLPHTAGEDLLEVIMRRYERASTLLTSNRPVDDGASFWAIRPLSLRCSTACCTTPTCSSVGHAAGGPKSRPICAPRSL